MEGEGSLIYHWAVQVNPKQDFTFITKNRAIIVSYFNSAHFHKKLIKIAKKFENRFETNTSKKKSMKNWKKNRKIKTK